MTDSFNVLISSAGRRVQLLDAFQSAILAAGLRGSVVAIDASTHAPAFQLADSAVLVPRVDDPAFLPTVLGICEDHDVKLLIPTIDTELDLYTQAREEFAARGTRVAVSSAKTIILTSDKRRTHTWLLDHGFPTVEQFELADILSGGVPIDYPAVIKPSSGSMSQGVALVSTEAELRSTRDFDPIVQTLAVGIEHTVSVLVNDLGQCRAAVPRRRLEVRAGEVSKGLTVRIPEMQDLACAIAEALPGAYGALNIQIFHDETTNSMQVIEINARFGGGDPLAWQAGADFPRWMIEELMGKGAEPRLDAWSEGVTMLRFDRAVYVWPAGKLDVG